MPLAIRGRARLAVVGVAIAALTAAPATWAAETIGHATSGTFPAGGPASAGFGGPGGPGGARGGFPGGFRGPGGASGILGITGAPLARCPAAGGGGVRRFRRRRRAGRLRRRRRSRAASAAAVPGGFGGDSATLQAAIRYAQAHGGGTIGVMSQSSAASAIVESNANIAGLGGFSGRESSVSVSWLAGEVKAGHLRWIVADENGGGRLPGDTRTGSQSAFGAAAKACKAVSVSTHGVGDVNDL